MGEGQSGRILQRLIDHAVVLGQFQQGRNLVRGGVGVELEAKTNLSKPHRSLFVNPERPPKVKISLSARPVDTLQVTVSSPRTPCAERVIFAAAGSSR